MRETHGRHCSLRIASLFGKRCDGPHTVVPAHTDGVQKGMSTKTSDLFVVGACFTCHQILDGVDYRALIARCDDPRRALEVERRIRAALVETQSIHVRDGLIVIPGATLI